MGWAEARAAIASTLDAAVVQVATQNEERLTAYEYPPSGQQTVFPLAFVVPPAREISRGVNNMLRIVVPEVRVRFLLHADNAELAAKRMDAWIVKATELVGANLTLDGSVITLKQEFSEFSTFGANGAPPYGFDMLLRFDHGMVEVETTRAA